MGFLLLFVTVCTLGTCWCLISIYRSIVSVGKFKQEMNRERVKMENARWSNHNSRRTRSRRNRLKSKR